MTTLINGKDDMVNVESNEEHPTHPRSFFFFYKNKMRDFRLSSLFTLAA